MRKVNRNSVVVITSVEKDLELVNARILGAVLKMLVVNNDLSSLLHFDEYPATCVLRGFFLAGDILQHLLLVLCPECPTPTTTPQSSSHLGGGLLRGLRASRVG
jgi:hypothetical protein